MVFNATFNQIFQIEAVSFTGGGKWSNEYKKYQEYGSFTDLRVYQLLLLRLHI
jgi:hypothetical protein